jgi:hypothetical protein
MLVLSYSFGINVYLINIDNISKIIIRTCHFFHMKQLVNIESYIKIHTFNPKILPYKKHSQIQSLILSKFKCF